MLDVVCANKNTIQFSLDIHVSVTKSTLDGFYRPFLLQLESYLVYEKGYKDGIAMFAMVHFCCCCQYPEASL